MTYCQPCYCTLEITAAIPPPNIEDIVHTSLQFFDMELKDILKKSRKREIVMPRQMIMLHLSKNKMFSLKSIGNFFNGKDHSTVIHARDTMMNVMQSPSGNLEKEIFENYESFLQQNRYNKIGV